MIWYRRFYILHFFTLRVTRLRGEWFGLTTSGVNSHRISLWYPSKNFHCHVKRMHVHHSCPIIKVVVLASSLKGERVKSIHVNRIANLNREEKAHYAWHWLAVKLEHLTICSPWPQFKCFSNYKRREQSSGKPHVSQTKGQEKETYPKEGRKGWKAKEE